MWPVYTIGQIYWQFLFCYHKRMGHVFACFYLAGWWEVEGVQFQSSPPSFPLITSLCTAPHAAERCLSDQFAGSVLSSEPEAETPETGFFRKVSHPGSLFSYDGCYDRNVLTVFYTTHRSFTGLDCKDKTSRHRWVLLLLQSVCLSFNSLIQYPSSIFCSMVGLTVFLFD